MGICDSDDKTVIKLDICYNPKISSKPEASESTIHNKEGFNMQNGFVADNIKQSWDQHETAIDDVQIKPEDDSDSDIEVDLAYRIIDTFNVCEVKTFKQEDEIISPDTETSLKIGSQNDHNEAQVKAEVENKANVDYALTYDLNICSKDKLAFIKENVDYESMNSKYDVNKRPVNLLQDKGML